MYQPIERKTLDKYVPNFDPARDPQVGEWVLVTPHRRAALLDPLISVAAQQGLQPVYPFLCGSDFTSTLSVGSFLDATKPASSKVDPRRIFSSLEEVRRRYRRRRRGIGGGSSDRRVCGEKNQKSHDSRNDHHGQDDEGSEEDDDTTLYLNPRALLLTSCAPAVFGGSDYIEGLDKDTGRVVFLNWRTGEVRTDVAALKPRSTPEWAEEVVEKAMIEWETWKRHESNASYSQAKDCDAPPLRKMRGE